MSTSAVTSNTAAAVSASSAKSGADSDKKLHFDPKKIENLSTSESEIIAMAKKLASADASPMDLTMFQHALQVRSELAATLSNIFRMLGDTARSIIQNIRA